MKVAVRQRGPQTREATNFVQPNKGKRRGAQQQDERLHQIRIDNRGQSPGHRVNPGGHQQDNRHGPLIDLHHVLQHDRRGVQVHGNLGKNVGNHGDRRQIGGAIAIEAPLEKLRHGEDVRTQVKRHKHPPQQQQHNARDPLKIAARQTRPRARCRQANKMLRRNVRNKKRSPDGEPANIAARQKILFRATPLFCEVCADTKNNDEVDNDDGDVERGQHPVGHRDGRCKQHQVSLAPAAR